MDLTRFDWINPLDGLLGRTTHGTMHRFSFDGKGQFSGRDVEMLLRQYGIHIWGRKIGENGERSFLVKKTQAKWAEYIMYRAGIPLTCPVLDQRNLQYAQNHPDHTLPTPWTDQGVGPRSLVDRMVDLVNDTIG